MTTEIEYFRSEIDNNKAGVIVKISEKKTIKSFEWYCDSFKINFDDFPDRDYKIEDYEIDETSDENFDDSDPYNFRKYLTDDNQDVITSILPRNGSKEVYWMCLKNLIKNDDVAGVTFLAKTYTSRFRKWSINALMHAEYADAINVFKYFIESLDKVHLTKQELIDKLIAISETEMSSESPRVFELLLKRYCDTEPGDEPDDNVDNNTEILKSITWENKKKYLEIFFRYIEAKDVFISETIPMEDSEN